MSIKKTLLFVSLFFGAWILATASLLDNSKQGQESKHVLILEHQTPNSSNAPRTLESIPFYAEQDGYCLFLGSQSNVGVVDISLVSTAGDDYETDFDTADGSIVIPISGLPGYYLLTITTGSGAEYIGEFEL